MTEHQTPSFPFRSLGIVGTGLLGSSVGLAVGKRDAGVHRIGIARRDSTVQAALECGAIDEGGTELERIAEVDWVVAAMPLAATEVVFGQLARLLAARSKPCTVIDVGSTKRSVMEAAGRHFGGPGHVRFVACHPMAGSERQGPQAGDADLFCNKPVILTPDERTDPEAAAEVRRFWELLGMVPIEMPAKEHDEAVARISHVPHLAAAAVAQLAALGRCEEVASTGYADMTRPALGDASLWTEILQANRDEVDRGLEELLSLLMEVRQALAKGDAEVVTKWLEAGRHQRSRFGGGNRSASS